MRIETHYYPNYREEIIKPLSDSIKKGNCKTLVGLKGAGLGPLVRFVTYNEVVREKYFENDQSYIFFFINFEELVNTDQKTFLKEFLRELRAKLQEKEPSDENQIQQEYLKGISSEDEQEILGSIKSLLEITTNNNLKVVCFLQELDETIKTNSPILSSVFNLYFNYRPNLVFVYCVRDLPNRIRPNPETKFDYTFQSYLILKPFSLQAFLDHYEILVKESNLKISTTELKKFYEYTGGMPSYNRLVQNLFDLNNLDDLDKQVEEKLNSSSTILVTRQLLASLKTPEIATLKALGEGKKEINQTDLELLQGFGLVTQDQDVFAKILKNDLANIESKPGLTIEEKTKKILIDEMEISIYLSPIEYKFLKHLFDNKGVICDREEIIEAAWGGNPAGISDEAVDQLVSRLRSKLTAKTGSKDLIKTVRGRGFTLE